MGVVKDFVNLYKSKHPGGIAWRAGKHADVVDKHLFDGEKVKYAFVGQKNDRFYDIFTSAAIVVTNKRLMIGQKRVVFGYFFKSITPELYNDMRVYQGLFWGKITIDTVKERVVISNLAKSALEEIETEVSQLMMEFKQG